jgi:hypothetical protein
MIEIVFEAMKKSGSKPSFLSPLPRARPAGGQTTFMNFFDIDE